MVKKLRPEDPYAAGRISLRVHPDLRSALDFLADADARPLSAFIELVLIIHARHRLANGINNSGERLDPKMPWTLRKRSGTLGIPKPWPDDP
jgi:hypothetical protein